MDRLEARVRFPDIRTLNQAETLFESIRRELTHQVDRELRDRGISRDLYDQGRIIVGQADPWGNVPIAYRVDPLDGSRRPGAFGQAATLHGETDDMISALQYVSNWGTQNLTSMAFQREMLGTFVDEPPRPAPLTMSRWSGW